MELSEVIEMCLNHTILLSFKDSFSSKCVEKTYPPTPQREGETSQRGHTKGLATERAFISVPSKCSSFLPPVPSTIQIKERGRFNKRAYYGARHRDLQCDPGKTSSQMLQKKGKDSFPLPGVFTLGKCTHSLDK